MKVAPLQEVLLYRNCDILIRFSEKYPVTVEEADEIFKETLKMMWLMAIRKEDALAEVPGTPSRILVYNPMSVIDEMWHNFVLFTKEYMAFCEKYFGFYIHHAPTTASEREKERKAFEADPEGFDRKFTQEIEEQCLYLCQKLGVETLNKWFKDFPSRFSSFAIPESIGATSQPLFAQS